MKDLKPLETKNGTGYKKAKSLKTQQQKRDRGLSIESA